LTNGSQKSKTRFSPFTRGSKKDNQRWPVFIYECFFFKSNFVIYPKWRSFISWFSLIWLLLRKDII
jgi:hypothetical protein